MSSDFRLEFSTHEAPEPTVIAGFPGPGMAAVSAIQYLIDRMDLDETGHVHAEGLPAITPYKDGRPYHATRLFSGDSLPITILSSELPVPIQHSEPFGRVLLDWIETREVSEVALLTAIPGLDGKDGLSFVASEDYFEARLADTDVAPLNSGFLTGVNASLIDRAMDTDLRVGVISTSTTPYRPLDPDAALRLVEGLRRIYDLEVDIERLRGFADSMRRHYEELAAQIDSQEHASTRASEDYGFM